MLNEFIAIGSIYRLTSDLKVLMELHKSSKLLHNELVKQDFVVKPCWQSAIILLSIKCCNILDLIIDSRILYMGC